MSGVKVFWVICAAVVVLTAYFGWNFTARGAYESAEYKLLESHSQFELREYPDLMLATTPMKSGIQGGDGSFSRLFSYISGGNAEQQKVAMTTPVFMRPEDQQAAGQMGFVLPQEIAADKIPAPANESVQIKKRAGGKFAVYRFAGRMTDDAQLESEEKLRQWMKTNNLQGSAEAEFAGYDPPWTPGPFRRNEVIIRVD